MSGSRGSAEPVQLGRNFAVASWLSVPSPSPFVSAPSPVSAGQASAHFSACSAASRGFWELCSLLPLLWELFLSQVQGCLQNCVFLQPSSSTLLSLSLQSTRPLTSFDLVFILPGLLVNSDQIARLGAHVLNQLT